MTITLDESTERMLQEELERGTYREPNEVIVQAIQALREKQMEGWLLQNADAVRASIQEGHAAVARGETYSMEEAEVILKARREARKAKAA